jgi:hypothetical protein
MYRPDTLEGVAEFCASEGQPHESIRRAEARQRRLFEIIDSINGCHGCLDQMPSLATEVERLRSEAA